MDMKLWCVHRCVICNVRTSFPRVIAAADIASGCARKVCGRCRSWVPNVSTAEYSRESAPTVGRSRLTTGCRKAPTLLEPLGVPMPSLELVRTPCPVEVRQRELGNGASLPND